MSQGNDGLWQKMAFNYTRDDGSMTSITLQTDGRRFVLSEHQDNEGLTIWNAAPIIGSALIKQNIERDSSSRPEVLVLYAEREDGRFDLWEAKTTKLENISDEPNRFQHRASEWLWKNAHQYEKNDLQKHLGVQLESGHQSPARMRGAEKAEHYTSELRMPNEAKNLREEALQSRSSDSAEQGQQHATDAQTQRQRYER